MFVIFNDGEMSAKAFPRIEEIDKIIRACTDYKREMKNNENVEKENEKQSEEMEKDYQKNMKERQQYKKDGYVYFVKDSHGFVKIGGSKNPKKRFSKFITENAGKIELIHQIYCDDWFKRESEFHNMFSEKRMNGERFDLSDSDINKILSIKK